MTAEPQQPAFASSCPGGAKTVGAKIRLRFSKRGVLRLVSHHDLMHCFERMCRRAALPVAHTRGFHPTPRLVFALSLALGIEGCSEVVELELTEDLAAAAVVQRLASQCPAGLEILSGRAIDFKATAQPRRVYYQLPLPTTHLPGLSERIARFLTTPECWIERTRPQVRRFNLRPFVQQVCVHSREVPAETAEGNSAFCSAVSAGNSVEMAFWAAPAGVARPEEVLGQLGLADLLDAGAILQRTRIELHDEPHDNEPLPPNLTVPGQRTRSAPKAAPPPTSLLPGPLSFDS